MSNIQLVYGWKFIIKLISLHLCIVSAFSHLIFIFVLFIKFYLRDHFMYKNFSISLIAKIVNELRWSINWIICVHFCSFIFIKKSILHSFCIFHVQYIEMWMYNVHAYKSRFFKTTHLKEKWVFKKSLFLKKFYMILEFFFIPITLDT